MEDTATVELSEAATVVVPPPQAEVPVLGREAIVAAEPAPGGQRAPELLDGLVAWHNRMPWAKRLRPEQVGQAGVVRFAFEVPQGPSGQAVTLKPLFVPEKLVAGQSAKQLLAFVRQHGLDASPAPADWPLRELGPAAGSQAAVHWRYLLSAAYPGAYGSAPLRALVGQPAQPGGKVPVGGRRGLSLPRVGGTLGLVAGLALAAVVGLRPKAPEAAVAAPEPAASAASAVAAKAAASEPVPASASQAAHVDAVADAASAAASAATADSAPAVAAHEAASAAPSVAASASAAAPADAHAHAASATAPAAPAHEPATPAGHEAPAAPAKAEAAAPRPEPAASQAAPIERPLPKPRPTIRPIHAPVETYDPVAAASARANGKPEPPAKLPNFALVTAVSEQPETLIQLRRRLRQAMGREGEDLKLELQPAPGGQVLALWPIPSRESATRLADTLRQAGIRMRVVEF